MTVDINAVSILPEDRCDDATAFREVIAYLKGVADTVAAQAAGHAPLSLRPLSLPPLALRPVTLRPVSVRPALSIGPVSLRPPVAAPSTQGPSLPQSLSLSPLALAHAAGHLALGESVGANDRRITLRFGEVSLDGAPSLAPSSGNAAWEPTRGGARLIDPGSIHPLRDSDLAIIWRRTLPYGAPTVSLAASPPSSVPAWADGERTSEVRLRTAELPREWYELTGTEGGHRA